MRVKIRPFQGIVTGISPEDLPIRAFYDLKNVQLEDGELKGRLGGTKVNTRRFGDGPGLMIAQFVPRREHT